MLFNLELLQEQLDAAGIPNYGARDDGTFIETPATTEQHRQQAAVIIANHNPAVQTVKQQASTAYTGMKTSNSGRLKYFPYFVHLQDEMLAVMSDAALTEQQCFTRLKTALKQDKSTNPDHQFAFNMFLRQSSRKNNVVVTEAVLDGLLYPARRTFYDEYEAFYTQGLLAGLSVILKNGNGG